MSRLRIPAGATNPAIEIAIALMVATSIAITLSGCSPSEPEPSTTPEPGPSSSAPAPTRPTPRPSPLRLSPEVAAFEAPESFLSLPAIIDSTYRRRVRERSAELLSPRPYPAPSPATREPTGSTSQFGIQIDWYQLEFSDGQRLRAAIVRPEGASPSTLIVALHGHDVAGLGGIDLLLDPKSYQHGVAIALAKAGHAVLAVETRGFGGSPTGELGHRVYTNRLRMQGREFHGQVVSDNREALDFALEILPDIERVGVVGCSMGGLSALYLSLFDARIEELLISGIMGSYAGSFSSHEHCPCSLIPGVLRILDIPQAVAASHAHRIAIENGDRDRLLGSANLALVADEIAALRRQPDREIIVHRFDGGHEHDLEFVVGFFAPSPNDTSRH